jgi:hypothetical protein
MHSVIGRRKLDGMRVFFMSANPSTPVVFWVVFRKRVARIRYGTYQSSIEMDKPQDEVSGARQVQQYSDDEKRFVDAAQMVGTAQL